MLNMAWMNSPSTWVSAEAYYTKKAQELTGTAIGELLRNYRLNIAKEILISKTGHTLNISEIAYQVGFNDPKYFTRCFTKHFNVPPSKFTGK